MKAERAGDKGVVRIYQRTICGILYINIYTYIYIGVCIFVYVYIYMHVHVYTKAECAGYEGEVSAIKRLLNIIGLFCKRAL